MTLTLQFEHPSLIDSSTLHTTLTLPLPSPISLSLFRPCPRLSTPSERPQCPPYLSLPVKGRISRALVSTSAHHNAATVGTVEPIIQLALSAAAATELFYNHPHCMHLRFYSSFAQRIETLFSNTHSQCHTRHRDILSVLPPPSPILS